MIAVISKGELVELGNHQQLLEMNGVYSNLVRIQLGAGAQDSTAEAPEEAPEEEEEV